MDLKKNMEDLGGKKGGRNDVLIISKKSQNIKNMK